MEPPISLDANALRDEQVRIPNASEPISDGQLSTDVVPAIWSGFVRRRIVGCLA